eukprot:8731270-Lingulodinium_polyedra.AAC.1
MSDSRVICKCEVLESTTGTDIGETELLEFVTSGAFGRHIFQGAIVICIAEHVKSKIEKGIHNLLEGE